MGAAIFVYAYIQVYIIVCSCVYTCIRFRKINLSDIINEINMNMIPTDRHINIQIHVNSKYLFAHEVVYSKIYICLR